MKMRIPFEKDYTDLLGEAVYTFAYYEWTIIYIIEYIRNGFVHTYSREQVMTSGAVSKLFDDLDVSGHILEADIISCQNDFRELYELRNALIHAHPITASNGAQILYYQTKPRKQYHDFQWPADEVRTFITKVDIAEGHAAKLLDALRSNNSSEAEAIE